MKKGSFVTSVILVWSLLFFIPGCNQAQQSAKKESVVQESAQEVLSPEEAQKLLTSVCYACHNPASPSHDTMLAPPLAGIKIRYMKATDNRKEFIERMATYVSDPNEELALMKGPIKRFGVMPKPALSEIEIRSIVTFIYDNELPAPEWFADHERKMHGNQ